MQNRTCHIGSSTGFIRFNSGRDDAVADAERSRYLMAPWASLQLVVPGGHAGEV